MSLERADCSELMFERGGGGGQELQMGRVVLENADLRRQAVCLRLKDEQAQLL